MKRITYFVLLMLAATSVRGADTVAVGIESAEKTFVPGEEISVKVWLRNFSGREIRTGANKGWLSFMVKASGSSSVPMMRESEFIQAFSVPHGREARVKVNLGEYLTFHETGQYAVQPVMQVGSGAEDFKVGDAFRFNIVQPAAIREQAFGVMEAGATRSRTRLYTVQRLTRNKQEIFVRVTDQESNQIIGLANLGQIVAFARNVEAQTDRVSNYHVLHQSGAKQYHYHVISPAGKVVRRWIYRIDFSQRPQLTMTEEGLVRVVGGTRMRQDDDPLDHDPIPVDLRSVEQRGG